MELSYISIKRIRDWILDVLFPEKCLGCGKPPKIICDLCANKIRKAERETENSICALYDYRDPIVKKAIWNLKYYNRRHLGERLGQLLYEENIEDISEIKELSRGKPIYVIPVPMSSHRKKERGYNQAEVIARNFCNSTTKEILEFRNDIVVKNRETLPQAKISNRTKRLGNIRGVFEIKNKSDIAGRTFIVVDDVTTTGATILEIIKILKKSGAKKAVGLTIAH